MGKSVLGENDHRIQKKKDRIRPRALFHRDVTVTRSWGHDSEQEGRGNDDPIERAIEKCPAELEMRTVGWVERRLTVDTVVIVASPQSLVSASIAPTSQVPNRISTRLHPQLCGLNENSRVPSSHSS